MRERLQLAIWPKPSDCAYALGSREPCALAPPCAAFDLAQLDDGKRADAEKFARLFVQPFWRLGIATIVIDHVTKAKDGRGRYSIGSERKLGGADVHLGFEVVRKLHRGSTGLMRIVNHKDRRGFLPWPRAGELHLSSDQETHAISWEFLPASPESETDDWRPTVLMQRVSEYLEQQPDEVNANAIYGSVKGKRDYLIDAVQFLVTDGYVDERPGNRGSRLFRSTKPYRDQSPTGSQQSPEVVSATGSLVPPAYGGNGNGTVDEADEERWRALLADEPGDDDELTAVDWQSSAEREGTP